MFDRYGVVAPNRNGTYQPVHRTYDIIREANDTIYGPIDTIYEPFDTIRETNDTIYKPFDTIRETNDTICKKAISDEDRLIMLILNDEAITQKAMKEKTGLSLSTVKRLIAGLQKKGRLVRIGNNRSGKWQVKI